MHVSSKIVAIVTIGIVGLSLVTPIFAIHPQGEEIAIEARENAGRGGSPTGLLKNFFTRGRAAVGGGTIASINATTGVLTVTERNGTTVTVNTDSKTQFRRRFWGKTSLSEMSVGDVVNVIGQWTDDSHTTISARLVRDLSIQKRFGVFFGTVQSVSGTGFVMQTISRGTLTVTIDGSTKLINRKEQTIVQTDIAVGHKVRVRGLWDNKLHTLTQVAQIKDFSLPIQVTPTATPTP